MSYFCAVNDAVVEMEILVSVRVIFHQQKIHLRQQARATPHLNQPWLMNVEVFCRQACVKAANRERRRVRGSEVFIET